MPIARDLLPEFQREMQATRPLLERLPAERATWKPHARSMSLADLAVHVASIPSWVAVTLLEDELDLEPPGAPPWQPPRFTSTADLLRLFDENVARGGEALTGASDASMGETWSLKKAGRTVLAMPRTVCLRTFVMNHLIHHRGQLSVYLRMCDVPLPQVYGPTADDTTM